MKILSIILLLGVSCQLIQGRPQSLPPPVQSESFLKQSNCTDGLVLMDGKCIKGLEGKDTSTSMQVTKNVRNFDNKDWYDIDTYIYCPGPCPEGQVCDEGVCRKILW